jgi:phosphonopyruvate decarboxylase
MTREGAVQLIIRSSPVGTVFVSTTGKLSREINEIREQRNEVGQDFMTVGGMGHASAIALGIAIETKEKTIVCLDGDGAALMHLGVMALIGELKPPNFVHVILNNGTHESVGGQPVAARIKSYATFARLLGYESGDSIRTEVELSEILKNVGHIPKPYLLEIMINSESRMRLSRPSQSPAQNKFRFIEYLRKTTL